MTKWASIYIQQIQTAFLTSIFQDWLCWEQYDTTAVLTRKTIVAEKGLLDFFEILKVFF